MSNPAPRLASDLTVLQRRRLSWRAAKGGALNKVAKRAGYGRLAVAELLEDQNFAALVEAYRSMVTMPDDERHRRLVEIALCVLEEAVIRGDNCAMLFILVQTTRGREAAEVLAKGVVKALERRDVRRPAAPPTVEPPGPPSLREPSCPVDNALGAAGMSLREQILDEVEIEAAVEATCQAKSEQPTGKSQRSRIPVNRLEPRQLEFLINLANQQSPPTSAPPETDPKNPNAPNTN